MYEVTRPLRGLRCRWKSNTKLVLREIWCLRIEPIGDLLVNRHEISWQGERLSACEGLYSMEFDS